MIENQVSASMENENLYSFNFKHSVASGSLSTQRLLDSGEEKTTDDSPLQVTLSATTSHPVLQEFLTVILPILVQVLPVLFIALGSKRSSPPSEA